MSVREAAFALVLVVASGLIVMGVWQIHQPAAVITAGVLLALVGWMVLADR